MRTFAPAFRISAPSREENRLGSIETRALAKPLKDREYEKISEECMSELVDSDPDAPTSRGCQ